MNLSKPLKQQNDISSDSFDESWKDQIESLILRGKSAGADLVEVFLEQTDNIGILAEQDTVTNVSPSFTKGAGIRVFLGGKDGFVSTNDLSDFRLFSALDEALGMLELNVDNLNKSEFEGLQLLNDYSLSKSDWLQTCPKLEDIAVTSIPCTSDHSQTGRPCGVILNVPMIPF